MDAAKPETSTDSIPLTEETVLQKVDALPKLRIDGFLRKSLTVPTLPPEHSATLEAALRADWENQTKNTDKVAPFHLTIVCVKRLLRNNPKIEASEILTAVLVAIKESKNEEIKDTSETFLVFFAASLIEEARLGELNTKETRDGVENALRESAAE
ncbi:MAG: hypothetical protein WC846_04775 [Candidatus Gracilibacteria bacterium]|jgi:hypothetical protein